MKKVLIFVLGAGVGSLITWKLVKEKYKKIADEEIASVIDRFKQKEVKNGDISTNVYNTVEQNNITITDEFTDEEKTEYQDKVQEFGYSQDEYTDEDAYTVEVEQPEEYAAPYVIAPEEFGEYDTKSWSLYSDGVLTDENDMVVIDHRSIIGDALEHFGDYDDDSVYVRNEKEEYDYEILKLERSFSEVNQEVD